MDIFEALYTSRAMRRVRPDPVPLDVQAKILDAAIRAPSGGNTQNWRFVLVDDKDVLSVIGPLYRDAIDQLWTTVYADRLAAAAREPENPESVQMLKVQRSAQWLADHFEQVPLYLFAFVQGTPPAARSSRRCGALNLRPVPKASAARSPPCWVSSMEMRSSRSSKSPATSIGSWPAA